MQHPGVEILSRDRSKTYKSAMDKGAPAATQVADRFHLVQNLEETLEKDNAPFHAKTHITNVLKEHGHTLLLPKYLPDFNPIGVPLVS
jgi:transposase